MVTPIALRSTALALAVAAAPARGDVRLRWLVFDGEPGPRIHLDARTLDAAAPPLDLAVDEGGGAGRGRQRVDPAVALILGIIPGFGIGHLVAGSSQWTLWLIADIVIFLVWPGGFLFTHDGAYGFLGLLVLVERIIEGISAYQAAGGGPVFREERGGLGGLAVARSPAERALPVAVARGAPR
jgi:hypothetical protein